MNTHDDQTVPSGGAAGRRRKRRRWPYLVIVLLSAPVLILFFAPRILSTPAARSLILARLNSRIDGTVFVRNWSISWTKGIHLNGIRFARCEPELVVEADGLTVGFSIPDLAAAAYAVHTAEHGRPIHAHRPLKGEINLFRGRISAGIHTNAVTLASDVNAFLKVHALDEPYFFSLIAGSEPAGGSMTVAGKLHALPGGTYDPSALKVDADIKIQDWSVAHLTGPLYDAAGVFDDDAKLDVRAEFSLDMAGVTNVMDGLILVFDAGLSGLDLGAVASMAARNGSPLEIEGLLKAQIAGSSKGSEAFNARGFVSVCNFLGTGVFRGLDISLPDPVKLGFDASLDFPHPFRAEFSLKADTSEVPLSGLTPDPLRIRPARVELGATSDLNEARRIELMPEISISAHSDFVSVIARGENVALDEAGIASVKEMNIEAESDLSRLLPLLGALFDLPGNLDVTGNITASAKCSMIDRWLKLKDIDIVARPFDFRRGEEFQVQKGVRASGVLSVPVAEGPGEHWRKTEADIILSVGSAKCLGIAVSDLAGAFRMREGILELQVETDVNGGKLLLPLRADSGKTPIVLEIPDNTRVLQDVRLTETMVDELLMFISPLLRGSAATTGTISARLDRFRVPLDGVAAPAAADFQCGLFFRDITLAPAGLMFEILSLARLQEEKVTVPDQDIQSYLREGRVYSSPLALRAGAHAVNIAGSTGLDGTLDYEVRVPITSRMVGREAYERLRGQSILLPIAGTVSQPVFDRERFLAELRKAAADAGMRELLEKAVDEAEGLLRKWLGR